MNQFVVLIDLEDERVVDVVPAEYLNGEPCAEEDETDDKCEPVRVHTSKNLRPVRLNACVRRTDAQEDEEGGHHEEATSKE